MKTEVLPPVPGMHVFLFHVDTISTLPLEFLKLPTGWTCTLKSTRFVGDWIELFIWIESAD